MKVFHFNHLKAYFPMIVSLAVILLGLSLIRQRTFYESKVLIDTNGVLNVIAGILFIAYGLIETRLTWIAISFPTTKINIEHNQIVITGKKNESKIEFSKIKKITFFEREFGRRSISNDIEFSKIETYEQGNFIITSFIVSPQELDRLLRISTSKKLFTETKFPRSIANVLRLRLHGICNA